ncbi:uncharacterized protein SPPG_00277 [Spizellomyces punctatus DAOM BR117]|uniref:Cytochrome P450 n=1 Tax=Spizellomyces punctatus (strain DAOM BR117) TaxID=645134 RepID=A0A0L0HTY4_SPIPD|nr:uncharacterized protein SPPG_00277 [Spizellomyces punctatus DAOM BR117]KND04552.1 hypothetical protein SPPG_00277 [Spizellomyces punctatus DAOM BR117]|eukprot:XP_016612591.1 hypothetical protein SPPG_00277 [Spizellomyces punctatus DAOM BR117]
MTPKQVPAMLDLARKFPKVHIAWWGPTWSAVVTHSDTIKPVLRSTEGKPFTYDLFRNWLGDGLLHSSGKKWHKRRRLLTPAFHYEILKGYQKVTNQCTDVFLDKMSQPAKDGTTVDLFADVSLLTLDVILRCAFSHETACQTTPNNPYITALYRYFDLFMDRVKAPWLYSDWIWQFSGNARETKAALSVIHGTAKSVIAKRRAELADAKSSTIEELLAPSEKDDTITTTKRYPDFLDILLLSRDETGAPLPEQDILDEVNTFLFEGHDTTASGLVWIMYALAKYPEFQELARKEVDGVLDGKTELEHDELGKLPFTTMFVKECLRMYPPVPLISRRLPATFQIPNTPTLPSSIPVPEGGQCDMFIYALHHDPTLWPNPSEFDPYRFTPENSAGRDPYAFVPFSAGPRNCIGQNFAMGELKTVTARVLKRFELVEEKGFEPKPLFRFVLRSENGVRIVFKERK